MFKKLHTHYLLMKTASLFVLQVFFLVSSNMSHVNAQSLEGLPLYYWHENKEMNFGDHISVKIVERMVGGPIQTYETKPVVFGKKLLGLGSILYFAREGDVVWGSGINGKRPHKHEYSFINLDVRAVRGPLTRAFLKEKFNITAPEIYGDPALLFPYLFPELKRKQHPSRNYIIIPNYNEEKFFRSAENSHVVYPTEPWKHVVEKILDSEFVIASSLHGVVIAEAYGIPARLLRISEIEPIFKYRDYYLGTNRPDFEIAYSIEEALKMGGEKPVDCDLKKLHDSFPFEFWPNAQRKDYDFTKKEFTICPPTKKLK